MQKFVCDATPPICITSITQLTQAMGLPFEILSLADSKPASQKFLVYNFQKVSGPDSHFFTDKASIFKGNSGPGGTVGGQCFKCGRKCSASTTTPDISSGGFPRPPAVFTTTPAKREHTLYRAGLQSPVFQHFHK